MKTKTITKNRKAERDMDVALLECESEFGGIYDDSLLDEVALSEIEDDEE